MSDQNAQMDPGQSATMAQLVKELGIDSLSKEKQEELVINMTEVLLKRIFFETMEKLGENGREEYSKMTEGEVEPEKIDAFFKERISNYDEMVQQVVDEFKSEMMVTNPNVTEVDNKVETV
jgi:hypothetical protein